MTQSVFRVSDDSSCHIFTNYDKELQKILLGLYEG